MGNLSQYSAKQVSEKSVTPPSCQAFRLNSFIVEAGIDLLVVPLSEKSFITILALKKGLKL